MIALKKIYLSVTTLLLLMMVFGTVTYAWISLSTINNLDGLSLSASTGEELQISLDGIHYSSTIPTQELLKWTEQITLFDVTTHDGINFYTGGRREEGHAIANKHYLSIELYFQTTAPEKEIYLVNNTTRNARYDSNIDGTFVVSRGVQWRARHTFQFGPTEDDIVEKDEVRTYYASDAVRLGFIELINDQNILDERDQNDLITYIFDPSEDESMSVGKDYGSTAYFLINAGTKLPFPEDLPQASYRLTEINPKNPYEALDGESHIATLQPTGKYASNGKEIYQGKVLINVWIEGWDANTFDPIGDDRIKIQLQFKALKRSYE
jgi:hypothetical protein